jgi:hypothetical protein
VKSTIQTIQVVLDAELLKAADRTKEREELDRAGYLASRQSGVEIAGWEAEAAWPGDCPGASFAWFASRRRTRNGQSWS